MVQFASYLCAAAIALVGCATQVLSHGYMYIPLAEFVGTTTSAWIVQIEPQFDADWNSIDNDTELIALYVEKAAEYGYTDNIRALLDNDTTLYGADCGFTNPDADAKDPPTDGTATFSRGVDVQGPCEIWLDDTMVLHNDDCALAFGTSDYETIKSVFTPVDYSSCSTSGCMLRFYWLAFQSVDSEYVWQIYSTCFELWCSQFLSASSKAHVKTCVCYPAEDCVPLTGPAEGETSTATETPATEAPATETPATEAPATETPTTEAPATETPTTEAPATEASVTETPTTEAPATETPTTEAPTATETETEAEAAVASTETPTVTSSTSTKCTRKRV
ncbi:hypothetical protein BBJ28_00019688 [Nothophytophthora sp. Chile5]|nr:hypothetical protein BBJ28_00019688 [Nothophytophthora sp. Chile5]